MRLRIGDGRAILSGLLLVLLNHGCAGSLSRAVLPTEQSDARTEITRVLSAQYAAIERGDLTAWASAFSSDVFLWGSAPSEVMSGREAMLATMNRGAASRMAVDVKRQYRSTRLHIGIAPSGRGAWIADEIDYTLSSATTTKQVRLRMSAVAIYQQNRWQICAAHFSVPIEDERAFAGSWPLPMDLPAQTFPPAEQITRLIPTTPHDHFPVPFSDRTDVLLIGTAPQEWVVGGHQAQQFTHQGQPGHIKVSRRGNPITFAHPTANLAWAAWNGTLTVPHQSNRISLPIRVLSVFLHQDHHWQKVQEHHSLPLPE